MNTRLLTYEMIENAIPRIPLDTFSVLDFIDEFRIMQPDVWREIVNRYGLYGNKRQYTSNNYVSQLIQRYSWKDQPFLEPHTPWRVDKEQDFREPTEIEKERIGGAIIAVYRKKPPGMRKYAA